MLLHSRTGPSEHRAIDLNVTIEEALNLAYHGARAETPWFNIALKKQLDPKAGMVDLFPQEFIRVLLNLIGNGFYAARNRADQTTDKAFEPTLRLTTRLCATTALGSATWCGTRSSNRSSPPTGR